MFFATDSDVRELLETCLPSEYGPYWLCDLVPEPTPRIVLEPLESWPSVQSFAGGQRNGSIDIQSEALSGPSVLPTRSWTEFGAAVSLNGLIHLDHGSVARPSGKRRPTRIAQCLRARNLSSGEMIEHREYARIFERLRRRARQLASVPTRMRSGVPGWPMTVAARAEADAGAAYIHLPF